MEQGRGAHVPPNYPLINVYEVPTNRRWKTPENSGEGVPHGFSTKEPVTCGCRGGTDALGSPTYTDAQQVLGWGLGGWCLALSITSDTAEVNQLPVQSLCVRPCQLELERPKPCNWGNPTK